MAASIWSEERLPRQLVAPSATEPTPTTDHRSPFQKDYDRLLFSTPVRRLSDKTQVWPMDQNDGVRTRLTHSHEVANLARSIGTRIHKKENGLFRADLHDTIQPMLQAIGLCHDLGNPPFGHQGEAAIGQWFSQREWIFRKETDDGKGLKDPIPDELWKEFTRFDGNPQTLRLLTKLQTHVDNLGLDFTVATLAASLKYPVGVRNVSDKHPISKKFGYFESELSVVEGVRSATKLKEGERHPLTWIMEACDDIAYSVLDVDDAMKKEIISPDDVFSIIKSSLPEDHPIINKITVQFLKASEASKRANIVRDIKINYLRAYFVDHLVDAASESFLAQSTAICSFTPAKPLMDDNHLCDALKAIAKDYAFSNAGVLRMEALGAQAISDLMTWFWAAIVERKESADLLSRRTKPKAAYVFSQISPNYLEDAVRSASSAGTAGTMRYREMRLLTDMISGMTDTFAIKLWEDLKVIP